MYFAFFGRRWLDGRVARALRVAGPMGRELDSLSDVVGFGVAPAICYIRRNYSV
nr:CDP-alcohol phosphatidyltransferase family protein [Veillonella denticariosi]